jgi:hypothetical protein
MCVCGPGRGPCFVTRRTERQGAYWGMVQFDQFILALVACAAVGRLICIG